MQGAQKKENDDDKQNKKQNAIITSTHWKQQEYNKIKVKLKWFDWVLNVFLKTTREFAILRSKGRVFDSLGL